MAPIQFLFTSAIVLSAAVVAAPINTNHVGAGKTGASAPSKHQSEPMRVAEPVMSSVPMMGIDTQAMKASAASMAMQTPPSTGSGQQGDGVFGVLNKLPIKREEEEKDDMARRQLDEVTSLLTSINTIVKREEELEERQLGLVKSVPEALGQAAQVEKLVTNLPIKRDGSGILGGLGGLGGVLGGSVKRDVEGAEKHEETYTEKALKGFQGWLHHDSKNKQEMPEIPSAADSLGLGDIAKRGDPVTGLLSGILAKRDTEGEQTHEATYTEKALKGFQGWMHHGSKDKQETPEVPSAADSLGLGDIAKRGDPVTGLLSGILAKRHTEEHGATYAGEALKGFQGWLKQGSKEVKEKLPDIPSTEIKLDVIKRGSASDPVGSLLSGLLAKREEMDSDETTVDGLAKRDLDNAIATASDALDGLAKRNGLDSVDALIKGLTQGGQLNNGLNIRQLNVLSSLATGTLSNAGKTAGELGKIATGKHRRSNGDAGSIADAAAAGLNVGNHHKSGSDEDEQTADVDDIAAEVAEGKNALKEATSTKGHAGGHLDKRQVPPIAGSDALSIVKGLVANPSAALTPVTKGVLVGGTALGDLAPH